LPKASTRDCVNGNVNERRTTLADIARAAGVHVTTVSLALRDHPRLPEKTRTRLKALAEKLGYVPDPFLRALVTYRNKVSPHLNPPTLGYVTNWSTRWGWKEVTAHPDFFAGAEAKAKELGFRLEHFWVHEPGLTQGRLSRMLVARGINGLIIASHAREMGDALQFDWKHFSAVKIDYFPHKPALHNVTNNQSNIVRLAMRQVMAAGYRRIGFVMHRGWDHAVDHMWTAGFLCEQQNLAPEERIPALIFPNPLPVERWFNENRSDVVPDQGPFEHWFQRHTPEIVISKGSFVLPRLRELGRQIPRDVAFADVFLEDFSGRIAGVRQNHTTVGALAVEILAGQLQHNKYGVPEIPTTTYVDGTWFDGATCPSLLAATTTARRTRQTPAGQR
jgi:LacI family transcriptional regulator